MLGKSPLRRVENHIFLMNFGTSRAGGARSDALQSAMKRGHVGDLQLDFSLSCHWVLTPAAGCFLPPPTSDSIANATKSFRASPHPPRAPTMNCITVFVKDGPHPGPRQKIDA